MERKDRLEGKEQWKRRDRKSSSLKLHSLPESVYDVRSVYKSSRIIFTSPLPPLFFSPFPLFLMPHLTFPFSSQAIPHFPVPVSRHLSSTSPYLCLSLDCCVCVCVCVCVKDCSGFLWERNEEQREETLKLSWLTPLGGQEAYTDILHLAQVHTIWLHSPVNWGFSSCWSRLNRAKFGAPGSAGSTFLWVQQQSVETGLVSGPA